MCLYICSSKNIQKFINPTTSTPGDTITYTPGNETGVIGTFRVQVSDGLGTATIVVNITLASDVSFFLSLYYRLKMMNKESNYTYRSIISVANDIRSNVVVIYPNPAQNYI